MKMTTLVLTACMTTALVPWAAQAQSDDGSTLSTKKAEAGQYLSDTAVTAKVKSALLAEKGLKSTDISVETLNGTVQLSGFVISSAQIDQAVDITRHTKGVKDVKNDLRLKTAS